MNYEKALEFVRSLAGDDDRWLLHSEKTAEVAFKIAEALAETNIEVDPGRVKIMGLFHDVGRSVGHGILHGWDGFLILKERGLESYARGAVSHWLKGRTIENALSESREIDRPLMEDVFKQSGCGEFTLEDKIVSLADSMTDFDTVTTVKNRYFEARKRYGDSAWLDTNERISLDIKSEFDQLLGFDLYGLFDGAIRR